MEFTIENFIKAKEKGELKNFTIEFLLGEGKNHHLAEFLDKTETVWVDLVEFPLKALRREMGHKDEGLIFSEEKDIWDKRIQSFVKDISNGYIPPPLIATDFWNDVHLADGAHRHEALLMAGKNKHWVIFFIKDGSNIDIVNRNLK